MGPENNKDSSMHRLFKGPDSHAFWASIEPSRPLLNLSLGGIVSRTLMWALTALQVLKSEFRSVLISNHNGLQASTRLGLCCIEDCKLEMSRHGRYGTIHPVLYRRMYRIGPQDAVSYRIDTGIGPIRRPIRRPIVIITFYSFDQMNERFFIIL